jgi:hypothetical protein
MLETKYHIGNASMNVNYHLPSTCVPRTLRNMDYAQRIPDTNVAIRRQESRPILLEDKARFCLHGSPRTEHA